MGNAAISGINIAASGTISASSQELSLPASSLLAAGGETRWRSKTNNDFCVTGLLSSFDTILITGVTAGVNATIRVRVSSADISGAAGDLYDVTVTQSDAVVAGAPRFDANYDAVACLIGSVVSGYVRFDTFDPDASFVEAECLNVRRCTQFTYNYGYGWQIQYEDRSTSQESRAGSDLIWLDNKRRHVTVDFKWIATTQRYGVVEEIDRDNGLHATVLLILDTASTNLARDSIVGLIKDQTPIVQPDPVFAEDGPLFAKQYLIKTSL